MAIIDSPTSLSIAASTGNLVHIFERNVFGEYLFAQELTGGTGFGTAIDSTTNGYII